MRDLAQGLSSKLGYKVWRSTKMPAKRRPLHYGFGVNKLAQYQWFEANEIPSLEYTTSIEKVKEWLSSQQTVFARTLLQSSCGKGIVVLEPGVNWIPAAGVYTKYKKKLREFRVHCYKNKVVAVVEKRRKSSWTGGTDTKIRNLANGYVFCQEVSDIPEGIQDLALKACAVTNSDFNGVDIGYNTKTGLFVIEVNAAPGIQGTNLTSYINTIVSHEYQTI